MFNTSNFSNHSEHPKIMIYQIDRENTDNFINIDKISM